jgi:hypothetical protein
MDVETRRPLTPTVQLSFVCESHIHIGGWLYRLDGENLIHSILEN